MLKNRCQLWKITLNVSHGEDMILHTYWGYNFTDTQAISAAIRWGNEENPYATVTLSEVELRP